MIGSLFLSSLVSLFFFYLVPSQPTEDEAHAIYISVIEIDHRDAAQPVQVKIKVFTDDLENALRNAYGHPFKLPDAQACVREGTSIEGYFQKHFKVKIDGNQVAISFEKGEKNADSTWLYFHLYGPGKWNELLVTADFFMELFPTQTTTLTVYDGGKLWFNKFTKGETVCRITL